MIVALIQAQALFAGRRLDAKYFASPAVRIRAVLADNPGVTLRRIGGDGGIATVFAPKRFKRTYAVEGEEFVPYLRPYDVFEFFPPEADRLSVSRTESLSDYMIKPGDLLQTCSGRNLGPLTIADDYLARFALSHDMLRISIADEDERLYALAFLQSATGQHLLRGDLSGSVIDHITADEVGAIQIPFIDSIREQVIAEERIAAERIEDARNVLYDEVTKVNNLFDASRAVPARSGWTVSASSLGTRLDAAFHADHIAGLRDRLVAAGGVRLGDVAQVVKPGGRYKTYYVEPGQGTPLLSGRQILQLDVVGAKSISARSVAPESGYELRAGWIVFQADGRAEESLGYPSVVTEDRDGWFASGHVGRLVPGDPRDTGWLWAAMASDAVQAQVASLACGSVVDALYPDDLANVVLPPRDCVAGDSVSDAWGGLSAALSQRHAVRELFDDALARLGV